VILWLRVRRAPALAATIAGVVAVITLLGDVLVPIPALYAVHALTIPIALLAPLAVSTVLGYGLTTRDRAVESVSTRPLRVLDTAYALVSALTMFLAASLLAANPQGDLPLAAGRNALGYVGLLLIGRRTVGERAAPLVPTGLTLLCAFFAADPSGAPRWWAWMLTDASDPRSWALAGTCLVLGATASLTWSRRGLA
jgi:hypothetical protein